jgi:hypothetical protein
MDRDVDLASGQSAFDFAGEQPLATRAAIYWPGLLLVTPRFDDLDSNLQFGPSSR